MYFDVSMLNQALYQGCEIALVAGRLNLTTGVLDAVPLLGRNAAAIVAGVPAQERGQVVLSGPAPIWAYLVVYHAVVHCFSWVVYDDGWNPAVVIAADGAAQIG